jgi:hypothetical protein
MGFLNLICAPFILVYLLVYLFFRYFEVRVYRQLIAQQTAWFNVSFTTIGISQKPRSDRLS